MAKDIILLGLNSRGDTTQKNSAVMTTADTIATMNITANVVILTKTGVVNDSYV